MIYFILEQDYNIINPVEQDFAKKFHAQSIKRLDSQSISEYPKTRPLLDPCWLVIIDSGVFLRYANKIPNGNDVVLVRASNKTVLNQCLEKAGAHAFKVINNYRVSDEVVLRWVESKLRCTDRTAKYLCNRVDFRLKGVVEAVQSLIGFDTVTIPLIRDVVEEVSRVSVHNVARMLVGIEDSVSYKEVVQWVSKFSHAVKWMRDSLIQELSVYESVFKAMSTGELSLHNYREFSSDHLKNVSSFKVKKIIELRDSISSEYLEYVILTVSSIRNDSSNLYVLLNLLRVGGNNVYSV